MRVGVTDQKRLKAEKKGSDREERTFSDFHKLIAIFPKILLKKIITKMRLSDRNTPQACGKGIGTNW